EALFSGRDQASEVSAEQEDDGLIQGDPCPDSGKGGTDSLGEPPKPGHAVGVLPSSALPEPGRVRVVMEGDDRLDAQPMEEVRRALRAGALCPVDLPDPGLAPAPLERVAGGFGPDLGGEGEVLPPSLGMPRRGAAADVALLQAPEPLPFDPVVFGRALDL